MAESGELNEGLVSDYLNRANNFLKVGMKNIKLLKKILLYISE